MQTNSNSKKLFNKKRYLIFISIVFFSILALSTTFCSKEPTPSPKKPPETEPQMGKIGKIIYDYLKSTFVGLGDKYPLDKDTIEKIEVIIKNILEKKQLEIIPTDMLTKSNCVEKKGYIMNFTEDKKIAVVLYNDFIKLEDANKIFSFISNPKKFLQGPNFYFEFNVSNRLKGNQMQNFKNLIEYLTENKEKIEAVITMGHTCDLGEDDYNLKLSIKRAQFLIDKLCHTKINLIAVGFSEYFPAVPNTSNENRAQNRRVEIVIVPKDN